MDGRFQRVKVEQTKKGTPGSYKGYLEGTIPAGYVKNYYTGEESKWFYGKNSKWSDGFSVDSNTLKSSIEKSNKIKDEKIAQSYMHHSNRCSQLYKLLFNANKNNGYLTKKNLDVIKGLKEDKKGRLVIPAHDFEYKIWSLLRISPNGFKRQKKGGKLSGLFFLVNPYENGKKLDDDLPILYSEGLSTAASISLVSGFPVVVCFHAYNLVKVVKAFSKQYPTRLHLIMRDDDHARELEGKENVGKTEALKAEKEVNNCMSYAPPFKNSEATEYTDFDDFRSVYGDEALLKVILKGVSLIKSKFS